MMVLEVDPNLVRPGWTPLVVLILLGIVLFFLGRSMIKQFGKIDVPADHEPSGQQPGPGEPGDDGVAAPASGADEAIAEHTITEPSGAASIPDLRRRPSSSDAGGTPPAHG